MCFICVREQIPTFSCSFIGLRPGSHLIQRSHDQVLEHLLEYPSMPSTSLLSLLLKAGYWSGALAIMKREPELKMDAIKLCLQFGDISLLDGKKLCWYLLKTISLLCCSNLDKKYTERQKKHNFFRVMHTKIHYIKIYHIWTRISCNTPR